MSYRDLQTALQVSSACFCETACRYANYLWLEKKTARSILALCRALYYEPKSSTCLLQESYLAYKWIIASYDGEDFLGNPRVSFSHQGIRMRQEYAYINRTRAGCLWYLTSQVHPSLPADPNIDEKGFDLDLLCPQLKRSGFQNEKEAFLAAVNAEMTVKSEKIIYYTMKKRQL